MNMTQLVLGCALGFIVAQGLLFGLRRLLGGKARAAAAEADDKSLPLSYVRAFIRYAAPVFASAAFVLLGAWTLQDYLSAKSAHAVVADAAESAPVPADSQTSAAATSAAAADVDPDATAATAPDPYADANFRVAHHARSASLKDQLVQRAELKARWELLAQLRQHQRRSQYDCEVADHADKYLKAGLDVWGFTTWQAKYFPVENYQGASLPQCQEIQSAVDPAQMNLKSAVARSEHP
jgi:hypothetical protein